MAVRSLVASILSCYLEDPTTLSTSTTATTEGTRHYHHNRSACMEGYYHPQRQRRVCGYQWSQNTVGGKIMDCWKLMITPQDPATMPPGPWLSIAPPTPVHPHKPAYTICSSWASFQYMDMPILPSDNGLFKNGGVGNSFNYLKRKMIAYC
jgi:hypothetical protein